MPRRSRAKLTYLRFAIPGRGRCSAWRRVCTCVFGAPVTAVAGCHIFMEQVSWTMMLEDHQLS